MNRTNLKTRHKAILEVPSDLGADATREVCTALNRVLADTFALYMKTKNFHWHMSGPHFRDYHLLLDEQATQIYGMTDDLAERVRKLGGTTLHSMRQASRLQRIKDNEADGVPASEMLAELLDDNRQFAASMREIHELCDKHDDVATASMLEIWIDETERRAWFLLESTRQQA